MPVNFKNIKADWSKYECRATWDAITSRELSEVLGVSLNSICNWRVRGKLPEPIKHPKLRGNKVYYRISSIRSWLENKSEDDIHIEWGRKWVLKTLKTPAEAEAYVKVGHDLCGVEKPRIPLNF